MKSLIFYINKIEYIKKYTASVQTGYGHLKGEHVQDSSLQQSALAECADISIAAMKACFDESIRSIFFVSETGSEINSSDADSQKFLDMQRLLPDKIYKKTSLNIPCCVIAAGGESICAGIIAAAVSKYTDNLILYYSRKNDLFETLCIHISEHYSNGAKKYMINLNQNFTNPPSADKFAELFLGKTDKLYTEFYTIEQLAQEK